MTRAMETKDTVDLLTEIEGLVTDLRDSDLSKISKLTKRLILSDCWISEDMQMLKLICKMIDAVDLRLHIYEEWLRDALDEDITDEELWLKN